MENAAVEAVPILIALSALPVVLFALWAEYYKGHLDELKKSRESEGAVMEAQRIRSAGLFALLLQALFFLTTADLRKDIPLYLHFFPVIGISIQTWLQAGLERRIQELFKKAPLSSRTARDNERAIGTGRAGPGFFRAFAWAAVAGFVYLTVMLGSLAGATFASTVLHANTWFSTGFMVIGLLTGVLGGLALNFALGPFYLKQVLSSREIDDPDLRSVFEEVFREAKLPYPAFQRAEVGGALAGAMMTGARRGRGLFRPAVFVTESLLERLDPAELKAVLAHEASHMALRHLARRFVYSCSLILAISVVSTFVVVLAHVTLARAGSPDTAHWVGISCGVGAFLAAFRLLARQSRKHELESDLFCVERLGVAVETLASALRKLEAQDPYSRIAGMGHPATEARILALKTRIAVKETAAQATRPAPSERDRGDRAA